MELVSLLSSRDPVIPGPVHGAMGTHLRQIKILALILYSSSLCHDFISCRVSCPVS